MLWSRVRMWSLVTALVCLVWLAALVFALLRLPAEACVLVRSFPPRATLFRDGVKVGITPVRISLAPGERQLLRLVRKGCLDRVVTVEADVEPRRGIVGRIRRMVSAHEREKIIRLASATGATLIVTSVPAGAEVFIDGKREGMTPFFRDGFLPGTHSLYLSEADSVPERMEVSLEAGSEHRVHCVLKSKVVALYRSLISNSPFVLTHYAELAHHLILRGQSDSAADVFREGLEAAKLPDATEPRRLFNELIHTYMREYAYPEETAVEIRPVCMELVQKAEREGIWPQGKLAKSLERMRRYDRSRNRRR